MIRSLPSQVFQKNILKTSHPVASKHITTSFYSSSHSSPPERLQHHFRTIPHDARKSNCNLSTSRTQEHGTPRFMKANTTIEKKCPPVEKLINYNFPFQITSICNRHALPIVIHISYPDRNITQRNQSNVCHPFYSNITIP